MSLLVKNEVAGITKQAFSFHSFISCAFNSRRFLLKSVSLKFTAFESILGGRSTDTTE